MNFISPTICNLRPTWLVISHSKGPQQGNISNTYCKWKHGGFIFVTNSIRVSSVSLINGTIKKKSNSTDRRGKNADKIRTPPKRCHFSHVYILFIYAFQQHGSSLILCVVARCCFLKWVVWHRTKIAVFLSNTRRLNTDAIHLIL